jgi:tetratricopeptide (TPR) repeat protein
MTKGFAAEETKVALARAASASEAARTPEYWTVTYGRINADMMRGDHRAARAGVEAFLAEAKAAGLPNHAAFVRRMRGFLKLLAGDFAGARADIEQALADYDERRDESLPTVFAQDLRANALAYLGQVAFYLGEFEEAERLTGEALRLWKDSAQPGPYAAVFFNRLVIGARCGRAEDVLCAAKEMRARADERDSKFEACDRGDLCARAPWRASRRRVPRRPRYLRQSRGQDARGRGFASARGGRTCRRPAGRGAGGGRVRP